MPEQLAKPRILAASRAVLEQDGLTDWSIERCARAANCAKGLVLHYYRSKGELWSATATSFASDRAGAWRAALSADGIAGLDALWEALATEVRTRRASALLQLRLAGVAGAHLPDQERRELRAALARVLGADTEALPPAAALEGVLEGYQLAILAHDDLEGVREAFFRYWITYVPA
jgi:AcrR family transcriptional regulator